MAAVVEQKVILSGVSWETYERLLNDYYERHGAHFFYDDGELEIVVLSLRRERANRDLATLVELAACELDIDFGHLGSTTFRSERLRKGFEPDSAFHFARVNDPDEDTPPDLVIDVEFPRLR